MKIRDAYMLANAKLKLRRRRFVVTVLVIGLLFGVSIMVLVATKGLTQSVDKMAGGVFGGSEYLIVTQNLANYDNQDVATQARESEATFRSSQVQNASQKVSSLVVKYGGKYQGQVRNFVPTDVRIQIDKLRGVPNQPGSNLAILPDSVLGGLVDVKPRADVVPVIVRESYAERILGMKPPGRTMSSADKYKRLVDTEKHASGTIFTGQIYDNDGYPSGQVTYQIIGIIPDNSALSSDGKSNILDALLSQLSNNSLYDMIVPDSLVGSLDNIYQTNPRPVFNSIDFIVKFDSVDQAKLFYDENNCNLSANSCSNLYVGEFLTSRIMLRNLTTTADKVVTWLVIAICIIAVFVTAGILSRVIDDERQATAIYRAVGASRRDIMTIYSAYISMVCLWASIAAVIVGYAGVAVLNIAYSHGLTVSARYLYGVTDGYMLTFFGLDGRIGLIVLVIFVTGLASLLLVIDRIVPKSIVTDIKE